MYAVLKNTLIAAGAAALFSVVTLSGNKSSRFLPEKQGREAINPFIKITAQDTPPAAEPVTNDELQYPLQDNGYGEPVYNTKAPLQLNNPSNIKTTTTYNPQDSSYTFDQKMGALNYRPPIAMSDEDYRNYQFKQQVKNYWKSRTQADSKSDPTKKQLIPKLNVGGELFDRLFGGNTVDIRPTGSAELLFGVITNRNQNPAIPVKQRKISNFDFNMKIQLNIVGKIGEKLKLTTNYNTEASFDFENQIKIQYAGTEDEILKKVEAGNVSLPLNTSLITGSQTLFGVKTTLQFGKLQVVAMAAQERGKKTELNVQNGAQTMTYTVQADNYEANRHYFLAQYFRDNYSAWLANTPIVQSPIQITKIEVYVTNKTSMFDQARNIAGFADLGEETSHVFPDNVNNLSGYQIIDSVPNVSKYPRNTITNLYYNLVDSGKYHSGLIDDRNYNTVVAKLTGIINPTNGQPVFNAGREFEVLTRARRLNPATDYYLNPRLGYISLNTSLNYDEVLSVSYQYVLNGKTYQVGEFSDQFPSTDQLIITKLLKSTQVNLEIPMWDLMMKNVYTIGAYSLSQTNFQLGVYYNNIKTGVDIPYIPYGSMNGHLLIQELGLDRINQNQDRAPDGYFDFIPNVTVNPQNGRIYFVTVEPFGNDLRKAFSADEQANHASDVAGFVFQELYDSTKVSAQQLPNKDRFKLKGAYQSATSNEFSLNAMNIPQGSVRVTAGGVALTENVDYTVDYTMGKVKIINESILNSGQAIKITAENNSLFNVQQKSMQGARFDYKYSKNLSLGGTILHYGERPLTQKVNIGSEPVSNTMVGIDYNYRANAPWLTRLVDKIPLIQTKEPSSIQFSGEGADLIRGHAKAISNNGGTSYIDDFEGSVSTIDLRSATAWFHASTPEGQPNLFPETEAGNSDSIKTGLNRAKLAWYTIDQSIFYQQTSGLTPPQVTKTMQSNHFMEAYFESDLFPKKTPPNGQPQLLPMLDLAFYPTERGPYNFDAKPSNISAGINVPASNAAGEIILNRPETRWGGIMRSLTTNDFQAANIEYIQFWMMDPFNEDYNNTSQTQYNTFHQPPPTNGELYFNLGSVSEDILHDGSMAYENGLKSPNTNYVDQTSPWGYTPTSPPYVNAFDIDPTTRPYQDVGYDGIPNNMSDAVGNEANHFKWYQDALTADGVSAANKALTDLSGDDYHFYRGDDYDKLTGTSTNTVVATTLYRYKWYNNVEGNSPTQSQYQGQNAGGYSTVAGTSPNIEDVNKDNTLNQSEAYYQYKIKVTPQDINVNNVGNNYIVNVIPVSKAGPDGIQRTVNFYQFKIPITSYDSKIGDIDGYNAIRFMRMFVKNFSAPVVMRFARLEFVRSDWRVYQENLGLSTGGLQTDNETEFDVSAVSYQENGARTPIDYVLPPGINQQQNVQTTNLVLLNEQSLSLRVSNLKDGDGRAVYKNITSLDIRSYKKIRMFVHAEKLNNQPLNNGDVHMFMRIGSDFTNNYYIYEIPVQLTAPGTYDNGNDGDKGKVWPAANDVILDLTEITDQKLLRGGGNTTGTLTTTTTSETGVAHLIGVVGEPNMGAITSIMIGIDNPLTPTNPKSMTAEIWVDELRVTDFNQHGGQAALTRVTAKLADFGQVSLSGQYSTPFFGSIDSKPTDVTYQTVKQYALNGTFQLGKFLPKDWKINLPLYMAQSEIFNTPQYDPSNGDVLMSNVTTENHFTNDQIGIIKNRAVDYTRQRGINLTNVSKQRSKTKTKSFPWDIENVSVTYAFTEQYKHNLTTAWSFKRNYNGLINYNYQAPVKSIEPFKNSKMSLLQSPWLALIKEINLKPMPDQFNFSTNVTRMYIETHARDITTPPGQQDYTQTQYNKTFNVSRNYSTKWDLTKNIKLNITATNVGRVLEPSDYGGNTTANDKNTIEQNLILKGGTNTSYNQTSNLNVLLPLNKIPALDFITQASGKYTANYQWIRRPFSVDTIGNTIQNAQTQAYTTQLNMVKLYEKSKYLKRVEQYLPPPKKKLRERKKNKNTPIDPNAKILPGGKPDPNTKKDSVSTNYLEIFDHLARVLMTLKQISGNYNVTQGTTLPGFEPEASIMGTSNSAGNMGAPGLAFVFGGNQGKLATSAADILPQNANGIVGDAERNNWLVHRQNFSSQYLHTKTQTLNYSANVQPLKSLKITLTGNMTHGQTESYFVGYNVPDSSNNYKPTGYDHYTPVFGGNYSTSIISLNEYSFKADDQKYTHNSQLFDNYIQMRSEYSAILAKGNLNSHGTVAGENGFKDGYDGNQQEVVVGAFISAYTSSKKNPTASSKNTGNNLFKKIPLPGWNLTFDGLGKLPAVKKYFKSIVLTHGYHSTLSYGSYSNNQAYGANHNARVSQDSVTGSTSNFVAQYVMNTVTVSESFSPLIKVNFMFVDKGKMKGLGANFEIKRDRMSTLSSNVPQVMDLHSSEYNIGATYTLPQVEIKRIKIRGKPLKSDLLSTVTLSFRQSQTVLRKVIDDETGVGMQSSQVSTGQNITTIKISITYSLTKNVNVRLYYDRTINKPVISTSFPTQTTNAGVSLRFVIQ